MAYGVKLEDGVSLAVKKRVITGLLLYLVAFHLGDELQCIGELGPLAVELVNFHFAIELVQYLVPSQEVLSELLSQIPHLHHLESQFLMLTHQHELRAIIVIFLILLHVITIFFIDLVETHTVR